MKFTTSNILKNIKLYLICGSITFLTSALASYTFGMIYIIPLLPFICILCWLIGGVIGFIVSPREEELPVFSYIGTVLVFIFLSFGVIYYAFCSLLSDCLFWTSFSSIVFAGCAYPNTFYLKKN